MSEDLDTHPKHLKLLFTLLHSYMALIRGAWEPKCRMALPAPRAPKSQGQLTTHSTRTGRRSTSSTTALPQPCRQKRSSTHANGLLTCKHRCFGTWPQAQTGSPDAQPPLTLYSQMTGSSRVHALITGAAASAADPTLQPALAMALGVRLKRAGQAQAVCIARAQAVAFLPSSNKHSCNNRRPDRRPNCSAITVCGQSKQQGYTTSETP